MMKIKKINDVISYLDNFYYMVDCDMQSPTKNKIGLPHQEVYFNADKSLFKNPEKVLSKMMVSYIVKVIDHEDWCYRKENDNKSTMWTIEWRIKPEYENGGDDRRCASVYCRFSVYPRSALQQKESE